MITNRKNLIGTGTQGKCYIQPNGVVYKKFIRPLSIKELGRFKYFLEYKNDSFLFPFAFDYDKEKFYGYITKKAPGYMLSTVFEEENLEQMIKSLEVLEKDIKYISEGKIVMYDFHSDNVMYNGKTLSVIDVDEYNKTEHYTKEEVLEKNNNFNKVMILKLFKHSILQNGYSSILLNKITELMYTDMLASHSVEFLKHFIDEYYKEDINNLYDLSMLLRR